MDRAGAEPGVSTNVAAVAGVGIGLCHLQELGGL